ncbi:hypothetical protein B0T11DRAFT_110599 [Plectosphaerella cucumerina]|uniref:Uncharacterized protein n=1 Tax=Plectosphaerella cucumerina TaxID=40658 RepID=A0A8K0TF19_9PEZI|nr:hypothetical protein B0T11DRAFT_110599 [Plectosphaerella cucumerina]
MKPNIPPAEPRSASSRFRWRPKPSKDQFRRHPDIFMTRRRRISQKKTTDHDEPTASSFSISNPGVFPTYTPFLVQVPRPLLSHKRASLSTQTSASAFFYIVFPLLERGWWLHGPRGRGCGAVRKRGQGKKGGTWEESVEAGAALRLMFRGLVTRPPSLRERFQMTHDGDETRQEQQQHGAHNVTALDARAHAGNALPLLFPSFLGSGGQDRTGQDGREGRTSVACRAPRLMLAS